MTRKTIRQYACDLEESGADVPGEPFPFTVDGRSYTVDLCDPHASKYRAVFAELIAAGRRHAGKRRTTASRLRSAEIRAWARQRGDDLPERGRIPARILADYETAHHQTQGAIR